MEQEQAAWLLPRLLIIGAGAIGNALLPRIARWRLESITIVDGDRVEAKNLERQELFAPVDIGRPKSEVAAMWFRNMPIAAKVMGHDVFVDANNVEELISMHDIVADCTDDAHVRRLIDRTCRDYGVPLVSGAVHGKQGQVIVLHAQGEGEDLLLPDIFTGALASEQDGCDMRSVPLHVLEEVARRIAAHLHALVLERPVVNGTVDQFDGKQWITFGPFARG